MRIFYALIIKKFALTVNSVGAGLHFISFDIFFVNMIKSESCHLTCAAVVFSLFFFSIILSQQQKNLIFYNEINGK